MRVDVPEQHAGWYDEYLESDHWQHVRQGALARALHRCVVCNSDKSLHVHHRNYARLGNERLDDLTVLCAECHGLFHKHGKIQTTGKVAQAYTGVIVNWSIVYGGIADAAYPDDLHIDIYDARNERNWKFTCNYVDQNGTPGGIHFRGLVEAMLGRKLRKRERVSRDRLAWMLNDRRVAFNVETYPDHPHIEPRVVNVQPLEARSA